MAYEESKELVVAERLSNISGKQDLKVSIKSYDGNQPKWDIERFNVSRDGSVGKTRLGRLTADEMMVVVESVSVMMPEFAGFLEAQEAKKATMRTPVVPLKNQAAPRVAPGYTMAHAVVESTPANKAEDVKALLQKLGLM